MSYDGVLIEIEELLLKGRRAYPTGTIKTWNGKQYVKQASGKWIPKNKVAASTKPAKEDKKTKKEVSVNNQNYSIVAEVDPKKAPKVGKDAHNIYKLVDKKGASSFLIHMNDGSFDHYSNFKRISGVDVSGLDVPKKKPELRLIDTSKIQDTPRGDAADNFKEFSEDQYFNARKSEVSNLGEDLLGSARHKRGYSSNLDDMEKEGVADDFVNRKELLKNDPVDLIITDENKAYTLSNLALHYAMQKMPKDYGLDDAMKKLGIPKGTSDDEKVIFYDRMGYANTKSFYESSLKNGRVSEDAYPSSETFGDFKKRLRKEYFDFYKGLKEKVEQNVNKHTDPFDALRDVKKYVSDHIRSSRENRRKHGDKISSVAKYSPLDKKLVSYHNNSLIGRSSKAANRAVDNVSIELKRNNVLDMTDQNMSAEEKVTKLSEYTNQIIEGKSLKDIIGAPKESRKKQITMGDFYVGNIADREGPMSSEFNTAEGQAFYLMKDAKMRGIQWGNSVTDDERTHHLKQSALAFNDLTDILNLPEKMGSFNGRLGLAIGARGKGSALAHYEPTNRVINLTRKGGVGSLAHEWGHFFDNVVDQKFSDKDISVNSHDKFFSENYATDKIFASDENIEKNHKKQDVDFVKSYRDLNSELDTVTKEIRKENRSKFSTMSAAKQKYWLSRREVFARAFECYVDDKLKDKSRINTYLCDAPTDSLWPSEEQRKRLKPLFDKVFSNFAKNKDLQKSILRLLDEERLEKSKNNVQLVQGEKTMDKKEQLDEILNKSFSLGPSISRVDEEYDSQFETKDAEAVEDVFKEENERIQKSTNLDYDSEEFRKSVNGVEKEPEAQEAKFGDNLTRQQLIQAIHIIKQFNDDREVEI